MLDKSSNGLERLEQQFEVLKDGLAQKKTDEVVDIFYVVNRLQKILKDVEGTVRQTLNDRETDAGRDSGGALLYSGENYPG